MTLYHDNILNRRATVAVHTDERWMGSQGVIRAIVFSDTGMPQSDLLLEMDCDHSLLPFELRCLRLEPLGK